MTALDTRPQQVITEFVSIRNAGWICELHVRDTNCCSKEFCVCMCMCTCMLGIRSCCKARMWDQSEKKNAHKFQPVMTHELNYTNSSLSKTAPSHFTIAISTLTLQYRDAPVFTQINKCTYSTLAHEY
jgi:hypothetical protein